MRKKLVLLGVVTSLIGSGVVIGAIVPAASQQPGTRFTVCDRNRGGYSKDVDLGKKGFSAGDQSMEVDTLRRPKTGAKVGRLVVSGTFVRVFRKPQDALFIVNFTATFRNGKGQWLRLHALHEVPGRRGQVRHHWRNWES
jgi:hypothetical protein